MWPFDSSYPTRSVGQLEQEYDFIIAGGGTAGCVLARRLSEGGKYTVLLVERGDTGDSILHRTPLPSLHHWSDGKHSTVFDSAPHREIGRSFSLVSGMGLGGSTRINGGQYTCGVPGEFNAWNQAGREGWSYQDLKPYFLKSERWTGPVPKEWHGSNGPLNVFSYDGYYYGSSQKAAEAAETIGFDPILDMHSPLEPSVGFNKMQFTVGADGTRQSAFRAYLPKEVAQSRIQNLHICTRAVVGKLGFSRNDNDLRAESVEIHAADSLGSVRTIKAKQEVILTCGTLETPHVLLLSGVGPHDHLRDMGVEVVQNLAGVGKHLDHLFVPTAYNCPLGDSAWAMIIRPTTLINQLYKYVRHGTGWFLCTLVEMEIFGVSSGIRKDGKLVALSDQQRDPIDPQNLPDFSVMTCAIADPRGPDADKSKGFFGLNCGLLRTKSQGHIRLRSLNPQDHPICDMNYLSCPEDWSALRAALRVSAELARQIRADGYPLSEVSVPNSLDDATLDEYIKEKVDTMYHYSSTCRMAALDDPMPGVVDDELRVHGIENLRIADASVLPCAPATHPQALIYAIAEKCADMVMRSHE